MLTPRVHEPAAMVDEGRPKSRITRISTPSTSQHRAALDCGPLGAREVSELQPVDLAGIAVTYHRVAQDKPRTRHQGQRPRRRGSHPAGRRGRDGGQPLSRRWSPARAAPAGCGGVTRMVRSSMPFWVRAPAAQTTVVASGKIAAPVTALLPWWAWNRDLPSDKGGALCRCASEEGHEDPLLGLGRGLAHADGRVRRRRRDHRSPGPAG